MISPAETCEKLNQLQTEFQKIVESGDTANILRCVINAVDFTGDLAYNAEAKHRELDFTEEEIKELDFLFAATAKVRGVLGKALLERVRKEKQ